MERKKTQVERSAATRAALVAAARPLFTERGYAAVGTDEIARAAGVTRGALYHQFAGKEELFVAVFEQVEADMVGRLGAGIADADPADPVAMLHADVDGWLAACAEPEVHRIAFIEAPAALGWQRWREIGRGYGVGLVEQALQALMDAGTVARRPVRPLAHVLVGALEEAALYAARSPDRAAATDEVRAALHHLVDGLVLPSSPTLS
jgi:AcrR family transcriptional regulator